MSIRKNHLRPLCAALCAIVLLSLFFLQSGVSTTGNGLPQQISADAQVTPIMDTTSMTQQEYLQNLHIVDGYYYLSDLEINAVGEGLVKQEVRNELS